MLKEFDDLMRMLFKAKKSIFDRIANALSGNMALVWDANSQRALAIGLRELQFDPNDEPTLESMERFTASLEAELGIRLGGVMSQDIRAVVDRVYQQGAKDITGTKTSFNLKDNRALSALMKQNVSSVGKMYDKILGPKVKTTAKLVLEEGLSKKEAGQLFQRLFDKSGKQTDAYWKNFANNVVTRARSMGQVEGYVEAGATRYRIVAIIDDITSPICRKMNGKVFTVDRAVQQRNRLSEADTPEDLVTVDRWRKVEDIEGLAAEQMPPEMLLPPYHYGCRTRTVQES